MNDSNGREAGSTSSHKLGNELVIELLRVMMASLSWLFLAPESGSKTLPVQL